jgi:hypothetical protein
MDASSYGFIQWRRRNKYDTLFINSLVFSSLISSLFLVLALIFVGSTDDQGPFITDDGTKSLESLILILFAEDDEAEATRGAVEAADDVGFLDFEGREDVVEVLIDDAKGEVANEDGGLAFLFALVGTGRAVGAGSTTTTSTGATAGRLIGLLSGNTGTGHFDLDLTGVQLGAIESIKGFLGISILLKGDEAISEGPGTTEDNLALGTRTNKALVHYPQR